MKKHGMSGNELYMVWNDCTIRARQSVKGIKVCPEWQSFVFFRDWALSNGWKTGSGVRLIDKSKDFGPGNCEVIPQRLKTITAHGQTHTIAEWSKLTGLAFKTIYKRLERGETGYLAVRPPYQKLSDLGVDA